VHFHIANLVYFGRAFPGDGYPDIDLARGGSLDGLITQLTPWTDGSMRVIPMRGEPTDGNTVREFLEMLKTVRDRVDKLISQGASEQKVEAADVTKEFDGRWGRHGRTASRLFVHEAFLSEMQKQPVPQRTP